MSSLACQNKLLTNSSTVVNQVEQFLNRCTAEECCVTGEIAGAIFRELPEQHRAEFCHNPLCHSELSQRSVLNLRQLLHQQSHKKVAALVERALDQRHATGIAKDLWWTVGCTYPAKVQTLLQSKSQAVRFEFAKLCAGHNTRKTLGDIGDFGIDDQEALVELAMICASSCPWGVANKIRSFGIQNEKDLIEIAKCCARNSGGNTAKFIKRFEIKNPVELAEIARLCAQHNGWRTAGYLENFGIKNQEFMVELAVLCAKQSGAGLAKRIKNFGIEDVEALVEIAKICAQQEDNGGETAMYIEGFGIHNQEALEEIARLCFEQEAEPVAKYFKNFRIENHEFRVEMAKLCTKQESGTVAAHIDGFGIQDQEVLEEIARYCIEQDAEKTANHFDKFGIQDQEVRVELARRCIQVSAARTVENIRKFSIRDQKALMKLAKLSAQQSASGTLRHIREFGIREASQSKLICGLCLAYEPELLSWEQVQLKDTHFKRLACVLNDNSITHEGVADVIQSMGFRPEELASLSKQLSEIISVECEEVRDASLRWFIGTLAGIYSLLPAARGWLLASSLWPRLCGLRAPALRTSLAAKLIELSSDPRQRALWSEQLPASPLNVQRLHLVCLPLHVLGGDGGDSQILAETFKALTRQKLCKDKVFAIDLITALQQLATYSLLSVTQKREALGQLLRSNHGKELDRSTLKKRAQALRGLLSIKAEGWVGSERDLVEWFQEEISGIIPTNGYEGDLVTAYAKHFLQSRHPDGLLTYVAGIKSLDDEKAWQSLGRVVRSVLEEKFKELRYCQETNLHLQTVFKGRPELEEKWKVVKKFDFEELSSGGAGAQTSRDWGEWLRIKLLDDKHLGDGALGTLKAYLEGSEDDKDDIFRELGEKLRVKAQAVKEPKAKAQKKKGCHVDNLDYRCARLQHECMKLARAEKSAHLHLLNTLITWTPEDSEFHSDLKGAISEASERSRRSSSLTVEVTDDPLDLLYSGTDVTGSCQRLDGNPDLNKGLLGILEDGKIQILAIKDSHGRAVARCFLKLMWDGRCPVLYQERTYPDHVPSDQQKVLNRAAKQRAKQLGLALASAREGTPHERCLYSLGGPAPYEYSDATRSGYCIPRGEYSHWAQRVSLED